MPTPISYPDTVGFRAGFNSLQVKLNGQEIIGLSEGKLSRKRERGVVYGTNADPIGKTRGKNGYEASITVFVAEFKAYILDTFGAGYADVQMILEVTITENGYDTQTHTAYGCTIDASELSFSEGTDPLKMASIDLGPTKILFNGVDDNARPLAAPAALG